MPNSYNMQTNNCGTYTAWRSHQRRKEKACEPCMQARRDYLTLWRSKNAKKLKESHAKWREENAEHVKAKRKAHYEANKEQYAEDHKAWKEANPEKMREYRKAWSEANPEKVRAARKAWKDAHPDYNRIKEHHRRARKLAVAYEKYCEQDILDAYGAVCHICLEDIDLDLPRRTNREGWEMGLHLDHLVPLAKGGSDTISNVRPAHGMCNTRKGSNILELAKEQA